MRDDCEYFIAYWIIGKRGFAQPYYIYDVALGALQRASENRDFVQGFVQSFELESGLCTGTRMVFDNTRDENGKLKKQRA